MKESKKQAVRGTSGPAARVSVDEPAARKTSPASEATAINESPRMVAQRERAEAVFGSSTIALQRAGPDEEEQPPTQAVQRAPDEEEQLPTQAVQRAPDEEEQLPTQAVQRTPDEGGALQGKMEPNRTGMPDSLKSGVEALSGSDLSDVRVHANSSRPAAVNAHAYAQGSDIHLGPGQEQHLPHEAWHVVQQREGRVSPTTEVNGVAVNDDAGLEQEADVMGAKAARR